MPSHGLAALDDEPEGDSGSRVIHLREEVSSAAANRIVLELLQHASASEEIPIHMFINSPGGSVIAGLSIIDTMRHIGAPVFTYAIGLAASMGAVVLTSGEKGHRYILPHSRVMIHQASGVAEGSMDDIRSAFALHCALESEIEGILSRTTGKSVDEIRLASRVDNWLKAEDAVAFGLVDHVLDVHPSKL